MLVCSIYLHQVFVTLLSLFHLALSDSETHTHGMLHQASAND